MKLFQVQMYISYVSVSKHCSKSVLYIYCWLPLVHTAWASEKRWNTETEVLKWEEKPPIVVLYYSYYLEKQFLRPYRLTIVCVEAL